MKKIIASLTVIFLMLGVIPVSAQNQAPPPPDQNDPYGQQSGPQNGQYGPYDRQPGPGPQYGPQSRPQYGQQPGQQPPDQQGDQTDAQQPDVARISLINGDVSLQHGDNGDWEAVTVNTPVSTDDRVSTGDNARAEIQLDFANVLRMSGSATAKIANISQQGIQVQVGQGLVTYTVLRGNEGTTEIDTPNAAIHPQSEGEYRIQVNSDAETVVIVRRGAADISTPQGNTHVDQGQMITVAGTDNPQYKTEAAIGRDDWDLWNADRNRVVGTTSTLAKTDPYYTGSGDLDANGTWSEVPDYGQVWTPSGVGPDWAPYRDGRWVYEPYYGWTWVSYEPWGWAPYHYGRWFVYGGNWAWWPGPVYAGYRPVWGPAYVSFFGFGGGFGLGFGFGFGRVGWLPCGPGDWYHPWFGRYGGRFNAVSVTNINIHNGIAPLGGNRGRQFSNVNEAMRNDRVRGGISSMGSNEFGRGAVSRNQERVSEASFRQSSVMTGKMPVTPSRESFSPTGRTANPASFRHAPPSSQHFFTSGSRTNTAVNSQASRSFGNSSNSARVGSSSGGNRTPGSFERPSQVTNSNHANNSASVQSSRPGWHSFTPPQSSGANRSSQGFGANNQAEVNNSRGSFTSPSRPSSQGQGSSQGPNGGAQADNRSSWQHFTPPSSASRGTSSNSYSRTPLNMRQPIVTQRGGESRSDGSSGYGANPYSAPRGNYSQPRGNYSEPQSRGNYSAPRGGEYSSPRPSYSAPRPSYSAPRSSGGGGGSRGGSGGGGRSGGGQASSGHSHR